MLEVVYVRVALLLLDIRSYIFESLASGELNSFKTKI